MKTTSSVQRSSHSFEVSSLEGFVERMQRSVDRSLVIHATTLLG